MSAASPVRLHAIYLVLNEFDFFAASLRSVYPHVDGITVVTSHDFDRFDAPVEPDDTVPVLLERSLDPDRKVNVIVAAEGSEAALRNRAMAFADPPRASRHRAGRDPSIERIARPDHFLIVDADEIWSGDDLDRLGRYAHDHPAPAHRVHRTNYWKTWRRRIGGLDLTPVLVTPGVWFSDLRHVHLTARQRASQKILGRGGMHDIPREVATVHHGNFLGDRTRIEAKLRTSGHRDQVIDRWFENVWDRWTPDSTDLHPLKPEAFPHTAAVALDELPREVTEYDWPSGWLDPP